MHTSLEVGPQALRVRCEGACHTVPSPLAGEGQGGGWPRSTELKARPRLETARFAGSLDRKPVAALLYPPPCPSPARGEGTLWRRSAHLQQRTRVRVRDVCMP